MLIKKFNFIFGFVLVFFVLDIKAVEIKISPDKNISITNLEKEAFKDFAYDILRFRISDEGAYRLLKENRVFSNEYIKKFGLNNYDLARLKVEIEMYLGNKFVKEIQKKTNIEEDVLLSYYLDHKDKFKQSDQVKLIVYSFSTPSLAIKFFDKVKNINNKTKIEKVAQELNATRKELGYKEIEHIKPRLRAFVKKGKVNYVIPPLILSPKYGSVFFVEDYKIVSAYKPFNEVKNEIKKIIYQKTLLRERKKLFEKYGVKQ